MQAYYINSPKMVQGVQSSCSLSS